MQELAKAEFATATFDETGMLRWLTRKRWAQTPWNTVQRVLDSKTAIKDLPCVESVDQVRNHVIVRANPPDVQDFGDIWSLSTLVARAGNGSVVSNLSITVTGFAQSAKLVLTYPNAFTVYLVGNTGVTGVTAGVPSMRLVGQAVKFQQDQLSTKMRAEATDPASIAAYGVEQVLEIPDSPFRQDPDAIDNLAQDLLAQLKDPKPTLQDIPLVGDLRLQLGDRVTLQDPDGLALNTDFNISSIRTDLTKDGGLEQTLTVSGA